MAERNAQTRATLAEGPRPGAPTIPLWMKLLTAAWVAIWFPVYSLYYPWTNFFHLSDVAIALTAVGFWFSSSLLVSSQAVSVLIGETLWCVDLLWAAGLGHHLIGGTEYMWDTHYPLWLRLLSLYHFVLPVLLVWGVWRLGYDRRGLKLQAAIGAAALVAGRFCAPKDNINFAFHDPLFHRAWGPAPLHLAAMFAGMILIVYLPTHWLLARFFTRSRPPAAGPSG